jgi:ATP-dependent Lon protease
MDSEPCVFLEKTNKKMQKYKDIILKTIISIQKYKVLDLFSVNETYGCINSLEFINTKINLFLKDLNNDSKKNNYINTEQSITNDLCNIIKTYGTENMEDLIFVCFQNLKFEKSIENIILSYFHPIGYKTSLKKKYKDGWLFSEIKNIDSFLGKIYGLTLTIFYDKDEVTFCGIVDDIPLQFFSDKIITNKLNYIQNMKPNTSIFLNDEYLYYIKTITLKDLMIFNETTLFEQYSIYYKTISEYKKLSISELINKFMGCSLFEQRKILIYLLTKTDDTQLYYTSYLLYDLLSNDINGNIDTQEQTLLFDCLPFEIKKNFKVAIKRTIEYTNKLSLNGDTKIPLEQQICLMNCNDSIKEKAMRKLAEITSKTDDSNTKSKQYLDGLLKIPFGVYKKEKIFSILDINSQLLVKLINSFDCNLNIPVKSRYLYPEINTYLSQIKNMGLDNIFKSIKKKIIDEFISNKRDTLITIIHNINNYIKDNKVKTKQLIYSGKNKAFIKNNIINFLNESNDINLLNELCIHFNKPQINNIYDNVNTITNNSADVKNYLNDVNEQLNKSIYGHDNAKLQIKRIICQWINGENSGHCFGFEGPPGVGKTSFAKNGIANCLKENNITRPFAYIAIGGSSNSSTLDGHNYTYVGSTWGRIVDILIETKCMNPVIFIDELDKVSNTEHGREIIGILTHLTDPTQNNCFQDKYFSGIDLDLSKVLFIFSYNDANLIDKILLDRIHRVKFEPLTLNDKVVIANKYILPTILKEMGLTDNVYFDEDVISYIIENYTYESGVRKLKDLFFEIIGEINVNYLVNNETIIPMYVTIDDVKLKYLKNSIEIKQPVCHLDSKVGVINGLWANSYGKGGILMIESYFYLCETLFNLNLTGLQGNVMKESMQIAKTLAWNLTNNNTKKSTLDNIKKTLMKGIHIHCGDGATNKDGPSAGAGITTVIYSLINNIKIRNNFAITGEINIQGEIKAIGGLDNKLRGGIKANITDFIIPYENIRDYDLFYNNLTDKSILNNITIHKVKTINEVFELIFVK